MLNEKKICRRTLLASLMVVSATVLSFAGSYASLTNVVQPVVDLLNDMLGPLLLVVGAVGALYCVILGVKYARAEEPQDREKAKAHLKGAIIGFVLIFILVVILNRLMPVLVAWADQYNTTISQ